VEIKYDLESALACPCPTNGPLRPHPLRQAEGETGGEQAGAFGGKLEKSLILKPLTNFRVYFVIFR